MVEGINLMILCSCIGISEEYYKEILLTKENPELVDMVGCVCESCLERVNEIKKELES